MDHKTYQPKMPDIMEAIFDAIYLLFANAPTYTGPAVHGCSPKY